MNFKHHKRKKEAKNSTEYWNSQYKKGQTTKGRLINKGEKGYNSGQSSQPQLALSLNPSEDLIKFIRWIEREYDTDKNSGSFFNQKDSVVDFGCGNGRNLLFLSETYGINGSGFDISKEAITQAKTLATQENLPLEFNVDTIAHSPTNPFPFKNEQYSLALDMMTSHFLNKEERKEFYEEVHRSLKYDGWFFLKTFLLDEDENAKRMIKDYPTLEHNSYIHPSIGVAEHVFVEKEIKKDLEPFFTIHKITRSHGHLRKGQAFKRRSMSIYAQKK